MEFSKILYISVLSIGLFVGIGTVHARDHGMVGTEQGEKSHKCHLSPEAKAEALNLKEKQKTQFLVILKNEPSDEKTKIQEQKDNIESKFIAGKLSEADFTAWENAMLSHMREKSAEKRQRLLELQKLLNKNQRAKFVQLREDCNK